MRGVRDPIRFPFVSMSLHAADALIVLARFVCTDGTGSTARHVPCHANRRAASVAAKRSPSCWAKSGETFQERIDIRHATPQRAIVCARIDIAMHAEQGRTAVSARPSPLPSIGRGRMHRRNVAKV
ncbi:hypothetical protein [Burkholderia contaminans]|uniref:hypothetical protein n=1 Tax=Burkholderia contaminans TaxID=488447 RepID=UPI000F594D8A|nr:hypothetical protein [Burkholderia contaminans]